MPLQPMGEGKKEIRVLDSMKDIQQFLRNVSHTIAIVWFTMTGCGASREVEKRFHRVTSLFPRLPIAKVDLRGNTDLAAKFEVQYVPYFLFFRRGRKVDALLCSKMEIIIDKIYEVQKKFPPRRIRQDEAYHQSSRLSTLEVAHV